MYTLKIGFQIAKNFDANNCLVKDIAGFMLDVRKELTVGDHGLLYILKFGANVCSIDNFEQN